MIASAYTYDRPADLDLNRRARPGICHHRNKVGSLLGHRIANRA